MMILAWNTVVALSALAIWTVFVTVVSVKIADWLQDGQVVGRT